MKKKYSITILSLAIKKRLDCDDQVEYKNAKLIKHSKSMWLIYLYYILLILIVNWYMIKHFKTILSIQNQY